MTRPVHQWRLTPAQALAVDALARYGDRKSAARALGVSPETVHTQLAAAMRKSGLHSAVLLAVAWVTAK